MADYVRIFFCLIRNNFLNAFFVAIMLFSSSTNYLPVNCCPLTSEEETSIEKAFRNRIGNEDWELSVGSWRFVQVENAKAQAANYPFCTIEPNVGVVAVPDPRLDVLSQLSHSQRVVPTSVEFVDIAGLVKGASQGEVFFLLSCFYLLQNLSTQMDIPFVSSFLHLCFFLLQIDFNGDIFFFFFMMVICLFYAML